SLPLPVQPWATAWAPIRCARATWWAAVTGRAMAVPRRYVRAYTAPARSVRNTKSRTNSSRRSSITQSVAPERLAFSTCPLSSPAPRPTSAAKHITRAPYCSRSQGTIADVSSPPEYASTTNGPRPRARATGALPRPDRDRPHDRRDHHPDDRHTRRAGGSGPPLHRSAARRMGLGRRAGPVPQGARRRGRARPDRFRRRFPVCDRRPARHHSDAARRGGAARRRARAAAVLSFDEVGHRVWVLHVGSRRHG